MNKIKGEFFVDYDNESNSYCIFHTDINTGFAYSSFSDELQAEAEAVQKNINQLIQYFESLTDAEIKIIASQHHWQKFIGISIPKVYLDYEASESNWLYLAYDNNGYDEIYRRELK